MKEFMKSIAPLLVISLIATLLFCEVYGVVYAINIVSAFMLFGLAVIDITRKGGYQRKLIKTIGEYEEPSSLHNVCIALGKLIALPIVFLLYEQGHIYTLIFLVLTGYLVGLSHMRRDISVLKYASMSVAGLEK